VFASCRTRSAIATVSVSSGFRANQNLDLNFKAMNDQLDKVKTAYKKVLIKVGNQETGNVTPSQSVDRYLTMKGIPHDFVTVPDGIVSGRSSGSAAR